MSRVLVQMNSAGLGGTEINAVQFAAAVREHGFESALYAPCDTFPEKGPSVRDLAATYGVEVQLYERPRSTRESAQLLGDLVNRENADILHVYGQGQMRGAYVGPCRFAKVPLVLTSYEMSISRYTLEGPPLIVCTRNIEQAVRETRRGDTVLITPPVDLDRDRPGIADGAAFRAEHGIAADDVLVGWVGRLDEIMKAPAVSMLIDAVARVESANLRLAVVGRGDAEARLREQAAEVNQRRGSETVIFTGPLGDPRPAYAAADIGAGMGGSAQRQLAFAKPFIALGERGWSELVTPETAESAFVDCFWSPDEFADGIERTAGFIDRLADSRDERVRLGEFGLRFAEENFGLRAMGAKLADVYATAPDSYTARMWMIDAHREVRAAAHRVLPGKKRDATDADISEYRYAL